MTQIAQILIIGRTDIFVCHSLKVNACPAFQRDEPELERNVAATALRSRKVTELSMLCPEFEFRRGVTR